MKPATKQNFDCVDSLSNFLVMNDLREQLSISLLDAGDFFTELHLVSSLYTHLQELEKLDQDFGRLAHRFMGGGYYLKISESQDVPNISELLGRGLVITRPDDLIGNLEAPWLSAMPIMLTLRGEWFSGIILGQPLQHTVLISDCEVSVDVPYHAVQSIWSDWPSFYKNDVRRKFHPLSNRQIHGDYTCGDCHNMQVCVRNKPATVKSIANLPGCIIAARPNVCLM